MDTRRLGAAEQASEVLRILEGIEGEDEGRLAALDRAGEDVLQGREPPRGDDDGHALVPVEAGESRERAALDLDDRDPERRRVEDDALERLPAMGHDEQPARGPARGERLLDRVAAGDDLLALVDEVVRLVLRSLGRANLRRIAKWRGYHDSEHATQIEAWWAARAPGAL